MGDDYLGINRRHWDERASAHAASADYEVDRLVSDPHHLSGVIQFDRLRLGSIEGLRGVHLQCHIGTDTVSLARLGARTGIGALCWLPDIGRWAEVVQGLLRPGGRLFLREGHPMLFSLAEDEGRLVLRDPYFERPEPVIVEQVGTYVTTDALFSHNVTHQWNHGLGEVVTALVNRGMELTALIEHDSIPWEALPGQMEQVALGEWRLRDRPYRLAHTYTLEAVKRGGT